MWACHGLIKSHVGPQMGSIEILVSAIRIARYFFVNIGYRFSVSLQYRVSISINGIFVHRRYKYLDTVFEHDQSCQVLTVCSFAVSEECEMKLNSLTDLKRRTVRKFLLSLACLQLFHNAIERR